MRRLNEIKSLVNMARALGTEPEPYLLEELDRLESQLKRIAERVQQHTQTDLAELFNQGINHHEISSVQSVPDSGSGSTEYTAEQMQTPEETPEEIINNIPVLYNEETQVSERVFTETASRSLGQLGGRSSRALNASRNVDLIINQ